jgi:hypothetical protein
VRARLQRVRVPHDRGIRLLILLGGRLLPEEQAHLVDAAAEGRPLALQLRLQILEPFEAWDA